MTFFKYSNFVFILLLALFFTACKEKQCKKNVVAPSTQNVTKKTVAKNGTSAVKNSSDFIPEGYFLLDSSANERFIAFVLAPIIEKQSDTFSKQNRLLVMLEKTKNGLIQSSSNDQIVLCKSCGGAFGDPYAGIELNNDILKVFNYGGSAWRWGENYTFRYQNDKWELIGATFTSYFNGQECDGKAGHAGRQLEDINFAAGKMQIVHTEGSDCKPYEDYWKKFKKKKAISLQKFPGTPAQWPNGKIKDGDGKE